MPNFLFPNRYPIRAACALHFLRRGREYACGQAGTWPSRAMPIRLFLTIHMLIFTYFYTYLTDPSHALDYPSANRGFSAILTVSRAILSTRTHLEGKQNAHDRRAPKIRSASTPSGVPPRQTIHHHGLHILMTTRIYGIRSSAS